MKKILAFLVLLLIPSLSQAVTITAVAGGGNWSSSASWSPAQTPTSADAVSLAASSGSITIDAAVTCLNLNGVNYTQLLNFSAGTTLRETSGVTFGSGMTTTGTGVLNVVGTTTMRSNGVTFSGTLLINTVNPITLGDNWTVLNLISNAGGAQTISNNSITVMGDFKSIGSTSGVNGTATVVLGGSGTWSSANANFSSFGINTTINTSGTVTLGSIITANLRPTFSYTAGSIVNTGSSLVCFQSVSMTLNTGVMHWGSLALSGGATAAHVTISSNVIFDGGVSVTSVQKFIHGVHNVTCGTLYVGNGSTCTADAGATIIVSNLLRCDGSQQTGTAFITSSTPGSPVYLNYTGPTTGVQMFSSGVSDINASPSNTVINDYYPGNLTNAVNFMGVTLPTSGGGGRFF